MEKNTDEEENKRQRDIELIFDISKTIKLFYEVPVILLTRRDYSDELFNVLCSIRTNIRTDNNKNIIDIIVDYHLAWLEHVIEIENFKKRVVEGNVGVDEIIQRISYTIVSVNNRYKYYQRYMDNHRVKLSNTEQQHMNAELEIVEDMHNEVLRQLEDQAKCFRNFDGHEEFKVKTIAAINELFSWLDRIHDNLSWVISKHINVKIPTFHEDLPTTLQKIVDDLQRSGSCNAQKMIELLKEKGKELSSMVRCTDVHDLEISKVTEKIRVLEDRIERLEQENATAAVMALQHKKGFLENRLASLENLKTTLKDVLSKTEKSFEDTAEEDLCVCEDFYQLKIFNHILPQAERERLITELCYLWNLAIFGERSHNSIISILSAADTKEEFTDEFGTYFVDEHSRKIYMKKDDPTYYQMNERNKLVPLADDKQHIYNYDECGRYFIDPNTRLRVYKANSTASEYMMDSTGMLLKVKEVREGITYYYDNYGRYYINEDGNHIYKEPDSNSEYENDGLGNLVRLRSHLDIFDPCPDDVNVTEDFRYLKKFIGPALRDSISDVILHQPADPINYLSKRLVKYRENMELKEKRVTEQEELNIEREIKIAEEKAAAERAAMEAAFLQDGGSEASYDSNVLNYDTGAVNNELASSATSPKT